MTSRKKSSAMKVNKKQNPARNGNGKASNPVPRKRRNMRDASRNYNPSGSVAAAYSTGNSGRAPKVTASYDSCRVVHREFLGKVTGQTAFTIASTYALNPGLSASFPWLCNIAQNWEMYHFSKLRFMFYTSTGSTTVGTVIMAPDYDASDSAPLNEQIVSSYEDVQEDAPWKNIICTLRPASMHSTGPKKFVRTGVLAINQDIKLYDVGNFFICVVDASGAVTFGKLWVEYDIIFHTPQLPALGSGFSTVGIITNIVGTTAANMFGTVASQTISGGLSVSGAANVLTVRNAIIGAEYLVSAAIAGVTISVFNDGGALAGATVKTALFDGFNAAGTQGSVVTTYLATASTFTITYNVTAVGVTETRVSVNIVPSNDAIF